MFYGAIYRILQCSGQFMSEVVFFTGGNSEQSPPYSCSQERSEANLEEEGILQQCESVSLKDTSSSGKKRPADQTNTGTNLKKART